MTDARLATRREKAPPVSRLFSDERLARRAASGDERALEAVYRRYHQDLYRFCLAMTGNAQDAQDALQNTMLKVLRALPGERRRIKLKPWLYRIARNEAIEVLRRRRDSEELEADVPTIGTVAETAETRERLRILLDDLEQLPERQRAVLLLRELSGCEFEEIGDAFGTSAAAARQTLYEARLGLRELEEGRERRCADVRRELSDGDGRVLRRRRTRAHLRGCPDCRAFQEAIDEREKTLAGIAPLPVAASAGLLQAVLGGGAGATGAAGGGGTAVAAGVGQTLATSAVLKTVAASAVAVVATTAADRTGLIDVPLPGKASGPVAAREPGERGGVVAADPRGSRGGARATAESADRTTGAGGAGGGNETPARDEGDGSVAVPPRAAGAPVERPDPESAHQGSEKSRDGTDGSGDNSTAGGGGTAAMPAASWGGRETADAKKPAGTPGGSVGGNPEPGPPQGPPPGQGNGPPEGKAPPEGKGLPQGGGPPDGKGPPEGKSPPEGKGLPRG